MPHLFVVFGATGHQGSSVISHVLNDPELSQKYKIRAITRDPNSEKAIALKEKAEVVQGDFLNRLSLETALSGAHTVFAMTAPTSFNPEAAEREYQNARTIADVAVEKGAEYLIFSTLPSVHDISGGKYTKVGAFDTKAKAEKYMRELPIKTAFYCPGSFMENFAAQPYLLPRDTGDGTWLMARHMSPTALIPLIDAAGDSGKFVGAILADPGKYEGKTLHAATALYSLDQIAAIMSKATGKQIVYKQIPVEDFKKSVPFAADAIADIFSFTDEFGYFGPDSEKLVAWAVENARGRPSTLEEYFEAHPLALA